MRSGSADSTQPLAPGKYVHPNIIYGTIHVAKTGGSSLNDMLANKFERVCGNKGNTYDYYSYNEGLKSMNVKSIILTGEFKKTPKG